MRHFGFVSALFVAATMAGCFDVDLAGATIKCNPTETGNCPDGQTCAAEGVCSAAATATPDGGTPPGPDMSTPPTTPILMATPACPGGMGYDVTAQGKPQVFACATKYSNNAGDTADSKCQAPFVLCGKADNIGLAACMKLGQANGAFFISGAEGKRRFAGQTAPACGAPGGGEYAIWSGCGKSESTYQSACQGFSQAIDCSLSGSFQCKNIDIGDTINTDAASGVLCCHP